MWPKEMVFRIWGLYIILVGEVAGKGEKHLGKQLISCTDKWILRELDVRGDSFVPMHV